MPKIIPIIDKREWLKLYEAGNSEAFIAKETHHNLRIVKKGIEDARRERDAQLARSELLRDALRRHQDQMLAVIYEVLGAVQAPPVDLQLPPVLLSGAKAEYQGNDSERTLTLVLDVEQKAEWELLREHLGKGDPLSAMLERWRKAMIRYLQGRTALRKKAETLLTLKTGLSLMDKPIAPPFIFSYTAIPLICGEALNIALGNTPSVLEEHVTANTRSGEVRYRSGTILAEVPGRELECRKNILDTLAELQQSDELAEVAQTYKKVEEVIPGLRRVTEELALLGVIPGRCRVCRRLGI